MACARVAARSDCLLRMDTSTGGVENSVQVGLGPHVAEQAVCEHRRRPAHQRCVLDSNDHIRARRASLSTYT